MKCAKISKRWRKTLRHTLAKNVKKISRKVPNNRSFHFAKITTFTSISQEWCVSAFAHIIENIIVSVFLGALNQTNIYVLFNK